MTERVVVIAGASSASGRAVATTLLAAGHRVLAIGSNRGRLAAVEATARFECDLTAPAAVSHLAAQLRRDFGRVDGLVHLVGGWRPGHSDEDFDWLEARLLTTLRHSTRAFLDDLSDSPAGRLAIVGSTQVDRPAWSNANYVTLKAAAEEWVASIAAKWTKGGTAAAVTFAVSSLGDSGTPVTALADAVAALWDRPASELNGSRIVLGS